MGQDDIVVRVNVRITFQTQNSVDYFSIESIERLDYDVNRGVGIPIPSEVVIGHVAEVDAMQTKVIYKVLE